MSALVLPAEPRFQALEIFAVSGGEFTAAARHLPAPAGSPIRYPNLAIDSAMQVHEIE